MVCPKCQARVAVNSNFCPECGSPLGSESDRSHARPGASKGFFANLWRENKPGFLILSILFLAVLGSFGYFVYSQTSRFVVTVDRIGEDEALAIVTAATLREYCVYFPDDCQKKGSGDLEKAIREVLPGLINPLKPGSTYARIVYRNESPDSVNVTRFLYRRPPGAWTSGNSQALDSKVEGLRREVERRGGNIPFRDKVGLALTTAVANNHGSFPLSPNEEKVWRLSNVNHKAEFQVEYRQNGKVYSTPILRIE